VSEVGDRMKGGAVKEDKSPENEAILMGEQTRLGQRGTGQEREIKRRI